MKTLDKVRQLPWIAYVDDERNIGNSIIVTLKDGWRFPDLDDECCHPSDPGCGVEGFDTVRDCLDGTRKTKVEYGPREGATSCS